MTAAAVVDICATIITNDDRFCSNFGIEMRRRWPIVNSCTLSVMLKERSSERVDYDQFLPRNGFVGRN